MFAKLKSFLRKALPIPVYNLLRVLRNWKDLVAIVAFLLSKIPNISIKEKLHLVKQLYVISFNVSSPHAQSEILDFIRTILNIPPEREGVVVEAGCFKGSSTAKFSLAAGIVGRILVVFDSFEGIPENYEPHDKDIFGRNVGFKKGDYYGTLEEVKSNVSRFGNIDCCRFIKGWFDETLPNFKEPIAAIYMDVDLASSTRTCLKYLYPLLEKGGIIYSQDGHLPLVLEVFNDDNFWNNELGYHKPIIHGIKKEKLIRVVKEA